MIDPKDFLSPPVSFVSSDEIEEISGTFSCPEQGCYLVSTEGLLNPNTRVVTWICSDGHNGKASI
jgi:hypothetical protein